MLSMLPQCQAARTVHPTACHPPTLIQSSRALGIDHTPPAQAASDAGARLRVPSILANPEFRPAEFLDAEALTPEASPAPTAGHTHQPAEAAPVAPDRSTEDPEGVAGAVHEQLMRARLQGDVYRTDKVMLAGKTFAAASPEQRHITAAQVEELRAYLESKLGEAAMLGLYEALGGVFGPSSVPKHLGSTIASAVGQKNLQYVPMLEQLVWLEASLFRG